MKNGGGIIIILCYTLPSRRDIICMGYLCFLTFLNTEWRCHMLFMYTSCSMHTQEKLYQISPTFKRLNSYSQWHTHVTKNCFMYIFGPMLESITFSITQQRLCHSTLQWISNTGIAKILYTAILVLLIFFQQVQ